MRDASVYTRDEDLDEDGDSGPQDFRHHGMSSPSLPTTAAVAAIMTTTSPTGSANAGAGAGATLLSRIGSVKKWGVRRKKGSVPPAQVESRLGTVLSLFFAHFDHVNVQMQILNLDKKPPKISNWTWSLNGVYKQRQI
jgi:hypothetical protein